jgi:NRAMP (natural resistance-associated macrophage protein)-like metal ion transporter
MAPLPKWVRRSTKKINQYLKKIGPGLITGASDDDPSGIATYSQAGARFGLDTLWTAIITFPLMAGVQEMCARIGLVNSMGLAGVIKKHYPKPILYLTVLVTIPAVVFNIGANIASMGAVTAMLIPSIDAVYFSIGFTLLILYLLIYLNYQRIATVLKYACAILLVYLIVPFTTTTQWREVFRSFYNPEASLSKEYLSMLVAILGTTISPYLFFWQASMEAEERKHGLQKIIINKKHIQHMRFDIDLGMLFSNVVMFFIMLTSGTVLYQAGVHNIETVEQAAEALRPLAGESAYWLFAIGIIGTGLLAIPVLCGSVSYMVAECFNLSNGLDKKFHEAKSFYLIIAISLMAGLSMNYLGISAIQALLYSALIYGLTAPILIGLILHISNKRSIMGKYRNGWISNLMGITSLLLMTAAAVSLVYLFIRN